MSDEVVVSSGEVVVSSGEDGVSSGVAGVSSGEIGVSSGDAGVSACMVYDPSKHGNTIQKAKFNGESAVSSPGWRKRIAQRFNTGTSLGSLKPRQGRKNGPCLSSWLPNGSNAEAQSVPRGAEKAL